MKHALLPAIACLILLGSAPSLSAWTTRTERLYAEGKRYIGTVVTADYATKTLVVKGWQKKAVFHMASARFPKNSGMQDLEPGEKVLIRYLEEGGKKVATSVIEVVQKHEFEDKAESTTQLEDGMTEK